MQIRRLLLLLVALCLFDSTTFAVDWAQWRGPKRTGVSSEKGLADSWPQAGPKLLWRSTEITSGYGSLSVVGNRIYALGSEGTDNEFVQALDASNGRQVWRQRIGKVGNPDQEPPYPFARSTPTIDGNRIYAFGSDGDIACLDAATGAIRWQKNVRTEFGGKPGVWAYAESPLVDGDVVVCTPGGTDATLLALNKINGNVIWQCALPEGDEAGYASTIVVNAAGKKQYVQFHSKGVVGVDAASGKLLWRALESVNSGANMATPIEHDGFVYSPGGGAIGALAQLTASADGVAAKEIYRKRGLPNWLGGAVLVDGYLYGTTNEALVCVDFKSGEVKWSDPSIGVGSICSADGMLFLHGENGSVALVEATPTEYRERGRLAPADLPPRIDKMEKAWSYPVVANGRLYIRDKNVLWCYDVAATAASN